MLEVTAGLEVTEIRELAIHIQCRTAAKRSAADDFRARLNSLISRAPRIRWW